MKTKDKILKGAEELFHRFGIKGITMDDIAKHMGMSKKTIYQFYKDKDDLVHQLLKQTLDENSEIFSGIQSKAKNIVDEIFLCMKQMQTMFAGHNPVMYYDLQKYYPQTWKLFRDFKSNFILKIVENSLTKGIKEGYVRKDINTKILAHLRIEQIELGFNQISFPPDKFNISEVQLTMVEHFLYGISTLKGFKLIDKYKEAATKEG